MIAVRERLLARDVEVARGRLDPSLVLNLTGYPGGGSIGQDRSLYRNNGTITGATWTRLPSGLWVLSFDGDDDIRVGGLADFNISTGDCSLGAWVKTTDTGATFKIIMGKATLSANEYSLYQSNANKLTFRMADGAANATAVANSITVSGTWYFVFGVRLSNVLYLFIDSIQQTTTGSFSGSPDTTDKQFRVGSNEAGTGYQWKGTIGSPFVYNRALTPAEIQQIYLATKGRYS